MATISLVLACSHSGFLYSAPEQWNETRARRSIRANVPFDSVDENVAKFARCMQGFATLKARLETAKPDVLLIFGDDQSELFLFDNLPAFGIYTGPEFEAPKRQPAGAPGADGRRRRSHRRQGEGLPAPGHGDPGRADGSGIRSGLQRRDAGAGARDGSRVHAPGLLPHPWVSRSGGPVLRQLLLRAPA